MGHRISLAVAVLIAACNVSCTDTTGTTAGFSSFEDAWGELDAAAAPDTVSDSAEPAGSCEGRCGEDYVEGAACQCDEGCVTYGDCCDDHIAHCGGCTSDDQCVLPTSSCLVGACSDGECVFSLAPECAGEQDTSEPEDATGAASCIEQCGVYDEEAACQCDHECTQYGDCCDDWAAECNACLEVVDCDDGDPCTTEACDAGQCVLTPVADCGAASGAALPATCKERCGQYADGAPCQCDDACAEYGDCCSDIGAVCACNADADCDDKNPCTSELCGAGGVCTYQTLVGCDPSAGPGASFDPLAACGNGACGRGETGANCPADCQGVLGCGVDGSKRCTAMAITALGGCTITLGKVYCWGSNDAGGLGLGPETVKASPGKPVPGLVGVRSLAGGVAHFCALDTLGDVYCWGDNRFGQLGNGKVDADYGKDDAIEYTPIKVAGVANAVDLVSLDWTTCALGSSGQAWCWGLAEQGETGRGGAPKLEESHPKAAPVVQLSGVVALAAGASHACARTNAGAAACWGGAGLGSLGNGKAAPAYPAEKAYETTPVMVKGVKGVVWLALGGYSSCASTTDDAPWCWGDNETGQLFNGKDAASYPKDEAYELTPVSVSQLKDAAVFKGSGYHNCVVDDQGALSCVGDNISGALGVGKAPSALPGSTAPVSPTLPAKVVDVGAMAAWDGEDVLASTCALLADGAVWCWGSNAVGGLGDGTTKDALSPVQVKGIGPQACKSDADCKSADPCVTGACAAGFCAMSAVEGCAKEPLPFVEPFDCSAGTPARWHIASTGQKWADDADTDGPMAKLPPCTFNLAAGAAGAACVGGKAYEAKAVSPRIDVKAAPAGAPLLLSLWVRGTWGSSPGAALEIQVLDTKSSWALPAMVLPKAPSSGWHQVRVDLRPQLLKSPPPSGFIQVRLRFKRPDCSGVISGPFIDDLRVEVPCSSPACDDGNTGVSHSYDAAKQQCVHKPVPGQSVSGTCGDGKCVASEAGKCPEDCGGAGCGTGGCCDLCSGSIKAKGASCEAATSAVEMACHGSWLIQRQASRGCDGASQFCSTAPADWAWGPWLVKSTCAKGTTCQASGGIASCVPLAASCNPKTNPCCDPKTGKHKPVGSQCSATHHTFRSRCQGKIIQRQYGYRACAGGSCMSTSSDYVAWGPWKTWKTCLSGQLCGTKGGEAACVDQPPAPGTKPTKACYPPCCDAKGKPRPHKTQCAATPLFTALTCSGDAIQQSSAYKGCSAKGVCSDAQADRFVTPPAPSGVDCSGTGTCVDAVVDGVPAASCKVADTCSGPCCDPATGQPFAAGTHACGAKPIEEWQVCKGNAIYRKQVWAGCDGAKQPTCSSTAAHRVTTTLPDAEKTCTGGEVCVPECNPTCKTASCQAPPSGPDLVVKTFDIADKKAFYTPADISKGLKGPYKVVNDGGTASGPFRLGLYFAKGTQPPGVWMKGGKAVATAQVTNLQPYASDDKSGTWTAKSLKLSGYGWYTVGIWADDLQKVAEPVEHNNALSETILIGECQSGSCCDASQLTLRSSSKPCLGFQGSPARTERKCSGSGSTTKVLERRGYYRCNGKSASCPQSLSNLLWTSWKTVDTCSKSKGEACVAKTTSGVPNAWCEKAKAPNLKAVSMGNTSYGSCSFTQRYVPGEAVKVSGRFQVQGSDVPKFENAWFLMTSSAQFWVSKVVKKVGYAKGYKASSFTRKEPTSGSLSLVIPTKTKAPGTYYIGWKLDYYGAATKGRVQESSESDNTRSCKIKVVQCKDKKNVCCDYNAGRFTPKRAPCDKAKAKTYLRCNGRYLDKKVQQPGCDGKGQCSSSTSNASYLYYGKYAYCGSNAKCVSSKGKLCCAATTPGKKVTVKYYKRKAQKTTSVSGYKAVSTDKVSVCAPSTCDPKSKEGCCKPDYSWYPDKSLCSNKKLSVYSEKCQKDGSGWEIKRIWRVPGCMTDKASGLKICADPAKSSVSKSDAYKHAAKMTEYVACKKGEVCTMSGSKAKCGEPKLPDLQWVSTDTKFKSFYTKYRRIYLYYRYKNAGTGSTGKTTYVRISGSGVKSKTYKMSPKSAGYTSPKGAKLYVEYSASVKPGSKLTLQLTLDDGDKITESNEGNNTIKVTTPSIPMPYCKYGDCCDKSKNQAYPPGKVVDLMPYSQKAGTCLTDIKKPISEWADIGSCGSGQDKVAGYAKVCTGLMLNSSRTKPPLYKQAGTACCGSGEQPPKSTKTAPK